MPFTVCFVPKWVLIFLTTQLFRNYLGLLIINFFAYSVGLHLKFLISSNESVVFVVSMDNENLKTVDGSFDLLTRFPSLADLELRNDIGELTSNHDYFEEHHSARRRIKKGKTSGD